MQLLQHFPPKFFKLYLLFWFFLAHHIIEGTYLLDYLVCWVGHFSLYYREEVGYALHEAPLGICIPPGASVLLIGFAL